MLKKLKTLYLIVSVLQQYQRERKYFLSERELKRVLPDTMTRAAWLGPSNF